MTTSDASYKTLAINGGNALRSTPWPTYDKGCGSIGSAEENAAIRAIRSQRLFRYDSRHYLDTEVGAFESDLQRYFGCAHALAVSSGTAALVLSLKAAGIGPGKRVACPVFTFAATPSAILLTGAEPVLVPADEDLYMDLDSLESILSNVDALVVVHMRGFSENMDAILPIAEQAGVPVFEDAVPALGVRLRGRLVGTFGATGSFSTQSDKSINTGEGGFVITNDTQLLERAAVLSGAYEGRIRKHLDPISLDDLSLPLYSCRMDEVRGAIAAVQLSSLEGRVERLAANYKWICSMLGNIDDVRPRKAIDSAVLGDALLLKLENSIAADAEWFARALSAEGIEARAFGDRVNKNVRAFWNWKFLDDLKVEEPGHPLAPSALWVSQMVDIPLSSSLTERDCQDLVTAVETVAHHWHRNRGRR